MLKDSSRRREVSVIQSDKTLHCENAELAFTVIFPQSNDFCGPRVILAVHVSKRSAHSGDDFKNFFKLSKYLTLVTKILSIEIHQDILISF